MKIELQRAFSPEVMDREEECGICGVPFRLGRVLAQANTDDRYDMGVACPECIAYLGERNPERFPSFGHFDEALRRNPDPIWPSEDAIGQSEKEGTFEELYAASWIYR